MFSQAFAFDQVLCWDISASYLDDEDDSYYSGYVSSYVGTMFDNSGGGRLCDDHDNEIKLMKSTLAVQAVQIAELRAIVTNLQGWKQKVRHGTDHLSTHRVSMGDEEEHGHMRGFNEVYGAELAAVPA